MHSFDSADGANPESALIQATDGYLYGTTTAGGANNDGTVYKITPQGALTVCIALTRRTAPPLPLL
ncbi:MAG TPA: choice-of-anchor tandem repeat GloVer-containing protein [Bryobacteraceae bacterium]|nr:choice-of-anchor tandem repeat GloVer-containing protein [Bryobacteraceae bacterium]